VRCTSVIRNKVFYLTVSFGYAEHVGRMVIPGIIMRGEAIGLPPISLEKMTLFVPADSVEIVNRNILWKIHLFFYQGMKNLFFGVHKVAFPSQYTVYVASVAPL